MKKTLLSLALALVGFGVNSQVVFKVNTPAAIATGYALEYVKPGPQWGVLNIEDPANSVTGDIMLVGPDSLACTAPTPGSLTGKIAFLYRGSCDFGSKALKAQTAGAIAVIIVNNIAGAPVGMAGGTDGPSVTVPVINISQATGALIRAQLDLNVAVNAFIGDKFGVFSNDLGMGAGDAFIAKSAAYPLALAGDASEFSVKLGAKVRNFGSATQAGFTINCKVELGGTVLFNETKVETTSLTLGDSALVTFNDFSQPTYSLAEYKITYTVTLPGTDDVNDDNVHISKFRFTNDVISLGRTDANGIPNSTSGSQPSPMLGDFKSCVFFQDANASRLDAKGIYFRAVKNAPGNMDGEEITIQALEWNDVFTNADDVDFTDGLFGEPAFSSYTYTSNNGDSTIYKEFDTPFNFIDNQRYLFCITTSNPEVFLGYDNQTKYNLNQSEFRDIYSPIKNGADWRIGFVGNPVSSIAIKTAPADGLGVLETNTIKASVYPNPARDIVNIAIAGFVGDANVIVTDITGKIVLKETISTNAAGKASVNTSELKSGLYIFNLEMTDGTVSNFNVAIN